MRTVKVMATALGLVMLLLASCTGSQRYIAGQAIDEAGKQFLRTAALYDALHEQKRISDAEYQKWAEFAPKFQLAYDEAYRTWLTTTDTQEQQSAADTILALKDRLLPFLLRALEKEKP